MDEALYNELLDACDAVSGAAHDQDRFNAAQEFCSTFWDRPDASDYAQYILATPADEHTDPVRFYSLKILERTVKNRWNSLDDEAKGSFKQAMIDLIVSGTKEIGVEVPYVKKKVVSVAAEVVKREWPQQWDDLLPTLVEIAETGATQAELVMLLLQAVAEDCVSSDFNSSIPVTRRNEILQALNSNLSHLASFFFTVLDKGYNEYRTSVDADDAAPHVTLLTATMQSVSAYVSWPPPEVIQEVGCIPICSALLREPDLRMPAVDMLLILADRKLPAEAREIRVELISALTDACESLPAVEDPRDEYTFRKRLVRTVSLVGTKYFLTLNMSDEAESGLAGRFLRVVLGLLEHPSCMITSFLLPFVAILLEGEARSTSCPLNKLGDFGSAAPDFCRLLRGKLGRDPARAGDIVDGPETAPESPAEDTDASLFIDEDFEDEKEYMEFHGVIRGKASLMLQRLAACFPLESVDAMEADLLATMESFGRASDGLNAVGYATLWSTATQEFGATALFVTSVLNGLDEGEMRENEAVWSCLNRCAEVLLSYDHTDPTLLSKALLALSRFARFLAVDDTHLAAIIDRNFDVLAFRHTDEAIKVIRPESDGPSPDAAALDRRLSTGEMQVRKRAGSSLIHIAKLLPDKLLEDMGGLIDRVNGLVEDAVLLDSETVLMYEMLVLVSNSAHDLETQANFLSNVMKIPLEFWTSDEVTAAMVSPEKLMSYLRMTPDTGAPETDDLSSPAAGEWWQESISRQRKLLHTMHTFWCVGRRAVFTPPGEEDKIAFPFAAMWPEVLPNVFQMVRTLNLLFGTSGEGAREAIEGLYWGRWVLAVSTEEIASLLGSGWQAAALWRHGVYDIAGSMAYWQHKARQIAYSLLALCAAHSPGPGGLFGEGMIDWTPRALFDCVFSPELLKDLEHRHLTDLIEKLALPLCLHCPTDSLFEQMAPLMEPLLKEAYRRASVLWERSEADGSSTPATSGPDALILLPGAKPEDNEVLRDKMKRDITRALLDVVAMPMGLKNLSTALAAPHKPVLKAVKPTSRKIAAGEFGGDKHMREIAGLLLLESEDCADAIMHVCVEVLSWQDASSVRKACTLWERLLPLLAPMEAFQGIIGSELFSRLIDGVINPSRREFTRDFHWQFVQLVKDIYCVCVLRSHDATGGGSREGHSEGEPYSTAPREILSTLPGVSEEMMAHFDDALMAERSERERKRIFNDILQDAHQILKNAEDGGEEEATRHAQSILDLPDKLVVFGKQQSGASIEWDEEKGGAYLKQLFDEGGDDSDPDL